MGYYANFHKKSFFSLITIYARLVYANRVLLANMVSIIKNYYLLKIESIVFLAPIISEKGV